MQGTTLAELAFGATPRDCYNTRDLKDGIGGAAQSITSIRMVTWLAPGLPLAFFAQVQKTVQAALGVSVFLESRTKRSGPQIGSLDPFANAMAEVGLLCAPAAVPHTLRQQAGFELLGITPLFDDERYRQQPTCYWDLVVNRDNRATGLEDLRGLTFRYSDTSSLSGWLGLSAELRKRQTTPKDFVGTLVQTGGHPNSLKDLRKQTIHVAAIDSNVLHTHPNALQGLKVVDSVGPWPSQPVVVRSTLDAHLKGRIKEALLTCGPGPTWRFLGFRPQTTAELEVVPSAASTAAVGAASYRRGGGTGQLELKVSS